MSRRPELYTPWREAVEAHARHVDRERELEALLSAIRSFSAGGHPVHIYLFGPRGVGKSHLLTVAKVELEAELKDSDVELITVPEDIPELRSAKALVYRIDHPSGTSRWNASLVRETHDDSSYRRRVVLFEGFDRQLRSLNVTERRELRRLLEERGDYLVATGTSLDDTQTGKEEAFYGAFDPWPIEPLTEDHAKALLFKMACDSSAIDETRLHGRLEVLSTLSGGNPRALIALASACADDPEGWVTDHLYEALRHFTAHYQMRFRDLSPRSQEIVECLAMAPRELTPTDLSELLDVAPTQISVQANRLLQDGVLIRRTEGRKAWYRIAEPMFRYWLEYRTAPWEESRVAWLGRMLEELLSPRELAETWLANPDVEMRVVIHQILSRQGTALMGTWSTAMQALIKAEEAQDKGKILQISGQLLGLPAPPLLVHALSVWMMATKNWESLRIWDGRLRDAGMPDLANLISLIPESDSKPISRDSFRTWLSKGANTQPVEPFSPKHFEEFGSEDAYLFSAISNRNYWISIDLQMNQITVLRTGAGAAWRLRSKERSTLARLPIVRASFLKWGRRFGDEGLITVDDLLAIGIRSEDYDLPELLKAAAEIQSEGLAQQVLQKLSESPIGCLPVCPYPLSSSIVDADRIAEIASNSLTRQNPLLRSHMVPSTAVLTWAATLARAGNAAWATLLEALKGVDLQPSATTDRSVQLGLVALAVQASQRFDELADVLTESWSETMARVRWLNDSQKEAAQGELHPELARLVRAALQEGIFPHFDVDLPASSQ